MNAKSDIYDFSEPSLTGKPGFELFKSQKDNRYYFHFNNPLGKAILYSQAYASPEARDNGVRSVAKNAALLNRFEKKKENNAFYFILRAGNRQEIARSPYFDYEESLLMALNFINSYTANENKPAQENALPAMPDILPPTERGIYQIVSRLPQANLNALASSDASMNHPEQEQMGGVTNSSANLALPRHGFRIEFYQQGDSDQLRGKITHPLTGSEETLQGVEGAAISAFIQRNIFGKTITASSESALSKGTEIKNLHEMIAMGVPAKNITLQGVALASGGAKGSHLTDRDGVENIDFMIVGVYGSSIVKRDSIVDLAMQLRPGTTVASNASTFNIKIFAHPIDRQGSTALLNEKDAPPLSATSKLSIQMPTHLLRPGAYRLIVSATCKEDSVSLGGENRRIGTSNEYRGTRLIQVI